MIENKPTLRPLHCRLFNVCRLIGASPAVGRILIYFVRYARERLLHWRHPMIEDAELLRRYVAQKSDAAFAELVHRRVDLVYSIALRQVGGDVHLAQDVTQKVFTALAHKAPTLLDRQVLSGWLYRSAQYAASDLVRSERRRRVRELESSRMNDLTASADPASDWDRLRPLLDEALAELDDPARDAIALRFFESRPFADIGRALQLTEEAARKRVDRALDQLSGILSRRGVTSTVAAVGAALAQQAAVAAPAGLSATVAGAALAGATATGVGLFAIINSAAVAVGASVVAGGKHEQEHDYEQVDIVRPTDFTRIKQEGREVQGTKQASRLSAPAVPSYFAKIESGPYSCPMQCVRRGK